MKKKIKFEKSPVLLRITGSGIPPPPPPYFTSKPVQSLGSPPNSNTQKNKFQT